MSQLELADYKLRQSGVTTAWYAEASAENQKVASDANGHLFEQQLTVKGYNDVGAAHLLRDGAVISLGPPIGPPRCFCRCGHAWRR